MLILALQCSPLSGKSHGKLCDGVTRRDFMRIGGLAMGGLSLNDVLRAESVQKTGKSHKAVIMIYLSGGPSHQDMYDLKMEAPAEIRGSFKPIATNVPGIEICEHMPMLAQRSGLWSLCRSLTRFSRAISSTRPSSRTSVSPCRTVSSKCPP